MSELLMSADTACIARLDTPTKAEGVVVLVQFIGERITSGKIWSGLMSELLLSADTASIPRLDSLTKTEGVSVLVQFIARGITS
eukprot:11992819-Ditylum_brightwellii.AAC.1